MAEDTRKILCPYCGALNDAQQTRCSECRGLFEPLSRRATQISMGPWYIRDKRHPFRPGCSYETLKKQIEAGRVKPTTVLRGPTTHQFWALAMNTPSVAHLVGYCHACGGHVEPGAARCPHCSERFKSDESRNELGLAYRTKTEAQLAQQALDKEVEQMTSGQQAASASKDEAGDFKPASMSSYVERQSRQPQSTSGSGRKPTTPFLPGADLLEDVLSEAPVSDDKPTEKTRTVHFDAKREPAAEAAAAAPAAAPPPPSAEPAAIGVPETDTAELPTRDKPINMPMVALILMNVILIIVVIAALMMTMSPSNGSQADSPAGVPTFPDDDFGVEPREPSPAPRAGDNGPTPRTPPDAPDIDEPDSPDTDAPAPSTTDPASGGQPAAGSDASTRPPSAAAERSGSGNGSGSSSVRDYEDPPDVSRPVKPVEKMHTRYPKIEEMVRDKRYEQAVNRFRGILSTIPMGQRTSDHDQYMRYLEQLVAREQAVRFFEVN